MNKEEGEPKRGIGREVQICAKLIPPDGNPPTQSMRGMHSWVIKEKEKERGETTTHQSYLRENNIADLLIPKRYKYMKTNVVVECCSGGVVMCVSNGARSTVVVTTTRLRKRDGDGLGLQVVVQALRAKLATQAALLEATEGFGRIVHYGTTQSQHTQQRVRGGRLTVEAVDPNGSCLQLAGDVVRLGDVLGPYTGSKAVFGIVGPGNDFINFLEGHDRHDLFKVEGR